ncbi:family 20 glycosylhydrolase [Flavihumibacter petaseus]|nr:family 20 glycosylhydrolase [Flavihumibacter petaseus]
MKRLSLLALMLLAAQLLVNSSLLAQSNPRYPLIPYPQELQERSGNFTVTAQTALVVKDKVFTGEADQLASLFRQAGIALKKLPKAPAKGYIQFMADSTITQDEGYSLDISNERILVRAKQPSGAFRAVQTIRQLAPPAIEGKNALKLVSLPAVLIRDFPVYAYRGMHVDVSRHFFTIDYLKKFIDRLALYKFNKLHLHLTDDQGWRVEIKKYPLLTEKSAWRVLNNQDTVCMRLAKETDNPDMELDKRFIRTTDGVTEYGGFYTQDQLRALVKYAKARHIDIVPEIDMPGHMDAAIQQYPFLACTEGGWKGGPFTVPICPCKETTFEFAENIFKEIFDIFPYEYVHLGADEVNKSSWKNYTDCKELMEKEGLKSVEELQSYFVHRMEKFFNANGKKLIGWDEILEGGVSSTANVMYWRSWVPKAPVEAAKNGNKVIMTPGNPLYFDAAPDQYAVRNVYRFNPIPKGLTEAEAANIIGAQANIWSEWIPTENRLEYMTLPRMLALPEVLWTNRQNDYDGFLERLDAHYTRLDTLKTKYRLPDIEGLVEENVFVDKARFYPSSPAAGLVLRYTTDGQAPTKSSPIVDKPISVTASTLFKLAAFKGDLRGDVYNVRFKQQALLPAFSGATTSGLTVSYYPGTFKSTADLDAQTAASSWSQTNLEVDKSRTSGSDVFGLRYKGLITVPADGVYTFFLKADDGAVLLIDGQMVVDNDGLHSAKEKSGQAALKSGAHQFELKFIEGGGGYTLELEAQAPFGSRKVISPAWFQ